MSTVYRGVDTRLDRPVAIKVMDPRLAADPAFRVRFEREARAAVRIDHPAVVDVYDQGEELGGALGFEGPVLFLVMELVEGGTLRDVLRARGALGVPAAIAVMAPVLAGLAEAHRLGLVHRDVKPENVLISAKRDVRVADFGLVTAAAQAGVSHAGMIMGTVAYLSPEQVATGAADARSDVYAAGVMLYELLTGAPPYQGETAISVAYRHVNSDVPAPSLIAGDVPPELDALVLQATRRDPAGRPADAGAMLAELHSVARRLEVPRVPPPAPPVEDHDTVPAVPREANAGPRGTRALARPVEDGPPSHLGARRRSRRVFAVWTAIVLVLALLVGVSAWWLGSGRWTAVPRLAGVERSAAERLLTEADLVPTVTVVYDNDVAEGRVAVSDPQAEAELLRGSAVAVTVSKGRPKVPEIAPGTPVEEAEAAVRAVTLTPERSGSSSDRRTGTVARTEPEAGEELPIGGNVTLVLGDADDGDRVRVPGLVGQSFESASDTLSDLGLEVKQSRGLLGRRNGIVIGQKPSPGELVDPGTTITLHTI